MKLEEHICPDEPQLESDDIVSSSGSDGGGTASDDDCRELDSVGGGAAKLPARMHPELSASERALQHYESICEKHSRYEEWRRGLYPVADENASPALKVVLLKKRLADVMIKKELAVNKIQLRQQEALIRDLQH